MLQKFYFRPSKPPNCTSFNNVSGELICAVLENSHKRPVTQ